MTAGRGKQFAVPTQQGRLVVPLMIPKTTCDRLRASYQLQCGLCARLERIADGLPVSASRTDLVVSAHALAPMLQQAHLLEEETLLLPMRRHQDNLAETARQLESEHLEDQSFAEEIAEALLDYLSDGSGRHAESLGYMLRGFFQGVRRHIAFEQDYLLPQLSSAARR